MGVDEGCSTRNHPTEHTVKDKKAEDHQKKVIFRIAKERFEETRSERYNTSHFRTYHHTWNKQFGKFHCGYNRHVKFHKFFLPPIPLKVAIDFNREKAVDASNPIIVAKENNVYFK